MLKKFKYIKLDSYKCKFYVGVQNNWIYMELEGYVLKVIFVKIIVRSSLSQRLFYICLQKYVFR